MKREAMFCLGVFLAGELEKCRRRDQAAVAVVEAAALKRSSSFCAPSHASKAGEGSGLMTLLMSLVSRRYRVTDRSCVPRRGSGRGRDRRRQGGAAKRGKNAACLRRLAGDRPIDGRSNPHRIGTVKVGYQVSRIIEDRTAPVVQIVFRPLREKKMIKINTGVVLLYSVS